MADVQYGSEVPRVFTPPLRELTPETSLGFAAIAFAHDILGLELLPWQQWLFIHMLELLPDGSLRFQTVVVLVARQNGKSTIGKVLALFLMLVLAWPLTLGTAQDLDVAEELWDDCLDLLDADPELAGLVAKVSRTNGKKAFTLTNRTRYKVRAANRKGGRGLSGNLVLLDELREHQNWLAWGAITKTTQAQLFSLILCLSNAGDLTSVVLRHLRIMAHKALGDPDGVWSASEGALAATAPVPSLDFGLEDEPDGLEDDEEPSEWGLEEESLGLFEWSADPRLSKWDRAGWAQANPSLGYLIRERKLAADCRTDPDFVFRQEVLCQWTDGVVNGPFPPGTWEAGQNEVVEVDGVQRLRAVDRIVSDVVAMVDTSANRALTHVAFAGYRADGLPQVEIVASRFGQDWVEEFLAHPKRRGRIRAVSGQTRGAPVASLMKALAESPSFPWEPVEWGGNDLVVAHQEAFDAVRDGAVFHNPQPVLDVAAATAATKRLIGGQVIDRQASPGDAAPLVAFVGALWLLEHHFGGQLLPPPPPEVLADEPGASGGDFDYSSMGF